MLRKDLFPIFRDEIFFRKEFYDNKGDIYFFYTGEECDEETLNKINQSFITEDIYKKYKSGIINYYKYPNDKANDGKSKRFKGGEALFKLLEKYNKEAGKELFLDTSNKYRCWENSFERESTRIARNEYFQNNSEEFSKEAEDLKSVFVAIIKKDGYRFHIVEIYREEFSKCIKENEEGNLEFFFSDLKGYMEVYSTRDCITNMMLTNFLDYFFKDLFEELNNNYIKRFEKSKDEYVEIIKTSSLIYNIPIKDIMSCTQKNGGPESIIFNEIVNYFQSKSFQDLIMEIPTE